MNNTQEGVGLGEEPIDGFAGLLERIANVAVETGSAVLRDVDNAWDQGVAYTRQLIDRAVKLDYFRDIASTAYKHAESGLGKASGAVRQKAQEVDGHLDKLAETEPEIAGFIDGFVNAWTTLPCQRLDSREYTRHVTYGRVVGFASSVPLMFGGTKSKVIGAIPYLVRGAQYLRDKVSEASASVDARYQPAAQPAN